MSLVWADFPSGTPGLYNSTSQMLGIWGAIGCSITTDPAPGLSGNVVHVGQVDLSDQRTIFSYPSNNTKVIMGRRVFISNLPTVSGASVYFAPQTDLGADICFVGANNSGSLIITLPDGTPIATSTSPFTLIPGSWHHLEFKLSVNGTTATYEVRLEGQTVLSGTFSSAVTNIRRDSFKVKYYTPLTALNDFLLKDFTFCNGTGSNNNDFLGTVSVTMQIPDSDISMPWGKSASVLTGHELVNDILMRGEFSANRLIGSTGYIKIDSTYYSFTSGSVDAGSPAGTLANPWLVARGLTDTISAANLVAAINATGTPGTTYSTALTAHTTVAALGYQEFTGLFAVSVQALNGVSVYSLSTTIDALNVTGMTKNLRADIGYISAGTAQINTPAVFSLSDLPSDITSVKGIISVARMQKVDGGDATLVVSLGDGVNYDDGVSHNVGTSPAWYTDVSELNPTTSAPWTPVQANAARIKVNRTV